MEHSDYELIKRGIESLEKIADNLEIQRINRDLEHYKTTTIGMWATDRPDLLTDDEKKTYFVELKG